MSRRTARRQRFYAHQRDIRAMWRGITILYHPSSESWYEALRGVMTDADRMAQEAAGIPLFRGEIGQLDGGFRFVGVDMAEPGADRTGLWWRELDGSVTVR